MKQFTELEKAEMVARWAHADTTDMSGLPYWTHCHRVAGNLRAAGYDEAIQAIGWMHDVIEDTHLTINDLYGLGFSQRVITGVYAMTQHKVEPLHVYWGRVKANPDALAVKLHGDIPDNDDPLRRVRAVGAGDMSPKLAQKLQAKYRDARDFLGGNIPKEAVEHWAEPTFDGL